MAGATSILAPSFDAAARPGSITNQLSPLSAMPDFFGAPAEKLIAPPPDDAWLTALHRRDAEREMPITHQAEGRGE